MLPEITLNPGERKHLRDLKRELKTSTLPDEVKARVPCALEDAVKKFRSRPENRDGRGVKWEKVDFIDQALRRVVLAVQHCDGHDDGNVRHQARTAVRACQHLSLDQIANRLKTLRGQQGKSGHRRKIEAKRKSARRLPIGEGVCLEELVTSPDLASVGRKLGLCVAHPRRSDGRYFHRALRDGESEFWVFEQDANPRGLIEVDVQSREVAEISARGNEPLKFKRRVGLEILRALDATADRVWEFARIGAFSPYVSGERPVYAGTVEGDRGRRYRFTAFPSQEMLVVREQRARLGRHGHWTCGWSLFKRETDPDRQLAEWSEVSASPKALSEGQLLALVCRAPRLAKNIGRLFD